MVTLSLFSACGNQAVEKVAPQTSPNQPAQAAPGKSSIYASQKFGFSFEIPEGFSLGELKEKTGCEPYLESYNEKHERELLNAAECAKIIKAGERQTFAKEIKNGAEPTEGPTFHDTTMYIFKKPYADTVEYIDKHILDRLDKKTYLEGHGKWQDQKISGHTAKTIIQNRDINVQTAVIDFEKYTMVIREQDSSGGFVMDVVTSAIFKTLKTK